MVSPVCSLRMDFASKAMASVPEFVNPLAPKPPPLPAKAKSVIFLFMYGGPSHMDTFDYKPELYPLDGKTIKVKTFGRGGHRNESRVVGPKWQFKQYGQCGKHVSDLFPHVGECVDDIAFLHSMTADSPIHGSAMLMMNSGNLLSGHPSIGSWVNYGLGSVNENLPGFVVMLDKLGGPISGAKNWSSGYMPASYQGTVLRSQGTPILDLQNSNGIAGAQQPTLLDHLRMMNEDHLSTRYDNTNLAARVASYELAYKMQSSRRRRRWISRKSLNISKNCMGWMVRGPMILGVNVCLPAEWSSVECAIQVIQEIIITMPTGMHMEILSKTTSSMQEILINRLPDC